MRYSQRLGSVVLVTTVSFPHSRRTWRHGGAQGWGLGGWTRGWAPLTLAGVYSQWWSGWGPASSRCPVHTSWRCICRAQAQPTSPRCCGNMWGCSGLQAGCGDRGSGWGAHSPETGGGAPVFGLLRDQFEGAQSVHVPVMGQDRHMDVGGKTNNNRQRGGPRPPRLHPAPCKPTPPCDCSEPPRSLMPGCQGAPTRWW